MHLFFPKVTERPRMVPAPAVAFVLDGNAFAQHCRPLAWKSDSHVDKKSEKKKIMPKVEPSVVSGAADAPLASLSQHRHVFLTAVQFYNIDVVYQPLSRWSICTIFVSWTQKTSPSR